MSARSLVVWLAGFVAVLAGTPAGSADAVPEVKVVAVVSREVTDFADSTGRTEAAQSVEVRARVTGYLAKVDFKDGSEVKKGDILFEIDPRPYQAELDRANAGIALAETHLKRAQLDLDRTKTLFPKGAASREDMDKATGDMEEAKARVDAARASRAIYALNLDFCRVTAPIDGRIGKSSVDAGNLVKADDTILTTIVSKDPMYVYFDVDERTYLDLRQALADGKGPSAKIDELPAVGGLVSEKGLPRKGKIDFVDNRVDPSNGTIRVRAVLPNPDGVLVPGLFARVRVTTSKPYKSLVVPEEAIGSAKDVNFVQVVNDRNRVEDRPVTLGRAQGGIRGIKEGLKACELVILEGGTVPKGLLVKPVKVPAPEVPGDKK